MNDALGILETPGFTPAMVALDAMEKAAEIVVVQAELNDFLGTVIKIGGSLAAVRAAIDVGAAQVEAMGGKPVTTVLSRPSDEAFPKGIMSVQEKSPLLQQNVVLEHSPAEPKSTNKKSTSKSSTQNESSSMSDTPQFALGFIETQGFTAVFEAIDSACKAANVEVLAKEKLGGGYITVVIKGDVAAVKAAIEAGQAKVGSLGKLIAAHVIARPSANVLSLLPKV